MANRLPAYILRDNSLSIEGNVRIGQVKEIVLPKLAETTEDMRNSGMMKPREVTLGYEKTEAEFKETALDPDVIKLFGLADGTDKNVIAYGYLLGEDGVNSAARCEMVCRIKQIDLGTWANGNAAETSYGLAVHSVKLFVDDEELFSIDDFDILVGGQPLMPGRADALRLT